jgi:6-pyruvoyltetrahydropterin/6-carboxytetrahydropterin synthase|tara:strand:- start:1384 stop:1911 length:528 start_codon:yes stop_codon:yes gene_type:complete
MTGHWNSEGRGTALTQRALTSNWGKVMATRIRRWIETDTGHRVPNHKSKCQHIHGHRYRWEAELEGDVVSARGVSEEGMLMDFSDVSAILTKYIHDVVDHAFIVYEGDNDVIEALSLVGDNHRTVIVPFIPTAENLARWAFEQVDKHITSSYGNNLRLHSFHVRETPKSWATWSG